MRNNKKYSKEWVSLNELQTILKVEGVTSRSQYWKWWDKYVPYKLIGRYPNRHFNVSWNVILNNTNRFGMRHKQFMPFHEALQWARKSGIESAEAWINRKNIHPAIPKRPDYFFKKSGSWQGWKHWLGNGKLQATYYVESQQNKNYERSAQF